MATEQKNKQEGPVTRSDILTETPEERKEREEKEISEGKRAPLPETVDQAGVTVTSEASAAYADAAPKATHPANGEKGDKKNASHAAPAHHSKK